MRGAEAILRTVAQAGIDVCFVNPGTTEIPLVAALEEIVSIRSVFGLFEGVLAGAADGFARIAKRPALVVVHQGPSFGNAVANLHNARRARSPVVVIAGVEPTWHKAFDPPLASDVERLAGAVSGFVRTSTSSVTVAEDLSDAIVAAVGPPGQVATLIVPADCQWGEARGAARVRARSMQPIVDDARVREAAALLRVPNAALILGGEALGETALHDAARIAAATGAKLFCETFPARLSGGRGLPALARVPYGAELAAATFASTPHAVLAGALDPVAMFAREGEASRLLPIRAVSLATPFEDAPVALAALAIEVGAAVFVAPTSAPPARPSGKLTPRTLALAIADALPDGAIVVDEGVSVAGALQAVAAGAARHETLALTGGACGQGLSCAAGAAIAAPDRAVIAIVGDGSALYAPQALFTQAREGLQVINVVIANRAYRILEAELVKQTGVAPGRRGERLVRLDDPPIDWPALAKAFGVPSFVADSAESLVESVARALATPGPSLIEARL